MAEAGGARDGAAEGGEGAVRRLPAPAARPRPRAGARQAGQQGGVSAQAYTRTCRPGQEALR